MDKVLAFDQSTRTTGYSFFVDGELKDFGKFTYTDSDIGVRLNKIRNKVKSLVEQYEPTLVILEDIQLQENVDTFKKLAEVFGVLYELLTEMEVPHKAVLSSTWRAALNIMGYERESQKRNAKKWVKKTYNIQPTEDECDAICIGAHCANELKVFDWSD